MVKECYVCGCISKHLLDIGDVFLVCMRNVIIWKTCSRNHVYLHILFNLNNKIVLHIMELCNKQNKSAFTNETISLCVILFQISLDYLQIILIECRLKVHRIDIQSLFSIIR